MTIQPLFLLFKIDIKKVFNNIKCLPNLHLVIQLIQVKKITFKDPEKLEGKAKNTNIEQILIHCFPKIIVHIRRWRWRNEI